MLTTQRHRRAWRPVMPIDYSLEVRKAVVKHLINDEGVTALVSASRIYGEVSDAKPGR